MSVGRKSKSQVNAIRRKVYDRDNERCVVIGSVWSMLIPCGGALTIQHRVSRGMGSSAKYDEAPYLLTMCAVHNQAQTSNALFAEACERQGWAVRRSTVSRARIENLPVWYQDGWHLLNGNERLAITPEQAVSYIQEVYGKAQNHDVGQSRR